MNLSYLKVAVSLFAVALLSGCVTPPTVDYSAFKESKPRSILVLPPVKNRLTSRRRTAPSRR